MGGGLAIYQSRHSLPGHQRPQLERGPDSGEPYDRRFVGDRCGRHLHRASPAPAGTHVAGGHRRLLRRRAAHRGGRRGHRGRGRRGDGDRCWPTTPTSTAARSRSPRRPSRRTARWCRPAAAGAHTGLTYQPEPELLQHAAGDDARHLHLHAQRRLDGDGLGDGDLCRRQPGRRSTTRRRSPRTPARPRSTVLANDTDPDAGPITIASVDPAGQRHGGDHRRRRGATGLTYQPDAELLQHPAGHDARHLHLHPDAGRLDGHGDDDGDLRRRPAGGGRRRGDGGRGRGGDARSTCSPTTPTSTPAR